VRRLFRGVTVSFRNMRTCSPKVSERSSACHRSFRPYLLTCRPAWRGATPEHPIDAARAGGDGTQELRASGSFAHPQIRTQLCPHLTRAWDSVIEEPGANRAMRGNKPFDEPGVELDGMRAESSGNTRPITN
jgi:hypothetical protein